MMKLCTAALLTAFSLHAAAGDQEVLDHLQRRSQVVFSELTRKYGCSTGGDWKDTIQKIFTRIIKASGRNDDVSVCVIKKPGFNAGALISGKFIIHADALATLGSVAKHVAKDNAAQEQALREILLAGIVGHELAHFYNQHSYKSYQKLHSVKASATEKDQIFTSLSFSRELEFDADRTGHMLLQTAGYDADKAMVLAFEVMKAIDDQHKAQGGSGTHH